MNSLKSTVDYQQSLKGLSPQNTLTASLGFICFGSFVSEISALHFKHSTAVSQLLHRALCWQFSWKWLSYETRSVHCEVSALVWGTRTMFLDVGSSEEFFLSNATFQGNSSHVIKTVSGPEDRETLQTTSFIFYLCRNNFWLMIIGI